MHFEVRNGAIATVIGSLTLLAIACAGTEAALPPTPTSATPTPEETGTENRSTVNESAGAIWLTAPSGNYQEGWGTLWEEGGSLFVEINVSPPEAVAQPAHIHQGRCSMLGGIEHRLANVIGGKSVTELEGLTIADVANGDLSINLHLSFADFSTFTACGEIPALTSEALQSAADDAPGGSVPAE